MSLQRVKERPGSFRDQVFPGPGLSRKDPPGAESAPGRAGRTCRRGSSRADPRRRGAAPPEGKSPMPLQRVAVGGTRRYRCSGPGRLCRDGRGVGGALTDGRSTMFRMSARHQHPNLALGSGGKTYIRTTVEVSPANGLILFFFLLWHCSSKQNRLWGRPCVFVWFCQGLINIMLALVMFCKGNKVLEYYAKCWRL